jgi:hypothetical protein
MYTLPSCGLNVNLWWGLAMLLPARGGAAGAGSADENLSAERR